MTMLVIEGFEAVGNSGDVVTPNGKFSIFGSNCKLATGRLQGLCAQFPNPAAGSSMIFPFQQANEVVLGIALRMDALTTSNTSAFSFYEGAVAGVNFGINSNGALTINRGANILYTGSAGDIVVGTWYYLELKHNVSVSAGTVVLKKDGVTVTTLTSQNTRPSSNLWVDNFRLTGLGSNSYNYSVDDMYILNTSGSINNDFLGKQKVTLLRPSADSGTQQWTPNSGSTHYDRVGEIKSDSDTTYLEDSTSGHADLFDVDNPNLDSISAIQVCGIFRSTDTGTNLVNLTCKSGATTSDGTSVNAGGPTYASKMRILETDPNTSSQWLNSGLTNAKFGIKLP
jgi:hypothetical protein